MISPLVTAKQSAGALTLVDYTPQIVAFDYCDGVIPYTARLKVSRNPDGLFVMCCACGCLARQLYKHPTRCGLCCTTCRSRAEHKADNAAERRSTRKPSAKKADEVAAKRVSKAKTTAKPTKTTRKKAA